VTVHQVMEVLVPVTIGAIIDRAIAPADRGAMVRWLLILLAQFVVLSASGCYALFVDEAARARATHSTRMDLARRVLHPGGGVERVLPGQVMSLSTVETNRVGEGVSGVILGVGAVTGVIAGSIILLLTSVWLGLAVVIGLPIVLVVVQILANPLIERADEHQEAVGVASGVAADLLRGLRVIKGIGADRTAADQYRRASRTALDAGLAANRVRSSYAGFTVTIAGAFVVLVAAIGAQQALDGQITVGELVAALGVTQFLVGPLGRLAFSGNQLALARAASARMDEALGAPSAVTVGDGAVLPSSASDDVAALAVDGLSGGALDGLTFAAAPGEIVAVVAEPAEASALVDVLDRSVDVADGTVSVHGQDHSSLGLDEARRAVLVSHHDAPLFAGSVRDNVAAVAVMDGGEGGDDAVAGATGAAQLDDVFHVTHGGQDRVLTEEGRSLSGGQRQRVALARALASNAPVVVLHDPLTAVDAATELRIASALRPARSGRTTVVLTASPVLLAAADRVVVVRDGRVAAEGTHHDLVERDAAYRELVLR